MAQDNSKLETWHEIPGYSHYKASNFGRVKSLTREIKRSDHYMHIKGKIRLQNINSHGYNYMEVYKDSGERKKIHVHQLIAIAFLKHKPNGFKGLIVDHIDNNRSNNLPWNLQLITTRQNVSKDKKNKTSRYTGVCWAKANNKWKSVITINKKELFLGYFKIEEEAGLEYKKALNSFFRKEKIHIKRKRKKYEKRN